MLLRKRPARSFTPTDFDPHYVKSLVTAATWNNYFGEPAVIHYTFSLPSSSELDTFLKTQPSYVDRTAGLMKLDEPHMQLFRNTLRYWENITQVHFIEDDNSASPIFIFTQKSNSSNKVEGYGQVQSIFGYASYPYHNGFNFISSGIGFESTYLKNTNSHDKKTTLLHEIMHWAFGMQHPFTGEYKLTSPREKYSTFSIMNYDTEIVQGYKLIPITPMPADIAATQFIYGKNEQMGAGDTTHHLKDYVPGTSWSDGIRTIATIVDHKGINTLSAENINQDVTLNIRRGPFARSQLRDGYVTLSYHTDIEKIICGNAQCNVVLNELNNHVYAPKDAQTTIFIDPKQCGGR